MEVFAAAALTGRAAATAPHRGLQEQLGCTSNSEEACLSKPGCHWFSRTVRTECDLCDRWFGDQVSVTGCRDWTADSYCESIVAAVQSRLGPPLADPAVREAIEHYEMTQGTSEQENPFRKRAVCTVWCDLSAPFACQGQPRVLDEVKGVNYGGRFIPEFYLGTPSIRELFAGIGHPDAVLGKPVHDVSLCDVGAAADAAQRMAGHLDVSIREEHFARMASLGFNVVRLPIGYWNFIDTPGNVGPNADVSSSQRWSALQRIMPASAYTPWIDKVFSLAERHGLRVLLDLHGVPGGQTDNAFTGCDQGESNRYFDTDWNQALAIAAIREMAKSCGRHGETCFGIELLNEPAGAAGPGALAGSYVPRETLLAFYKTAITVAREHIAWDKPILIMDWPAWLQWWMAQDPLTFLECGRIMFSTHVYYVGPKEADQGAARAKYANDLELMRSFHVNTRYDILVTEYALSNHGTGEREGDAFDYNSLANWFVHRFNQNGIGSMVWNFDAGPKAWGPVAADTVGKRAVDWSSIFRGTPATTAYQV